MLKAAAIPASPSMTTTLVVAKPVSSGVRSTALVEVNSESDHGAVAGGEGGDEGARGSSITGKFQGTMMPTTPRAG